MSTGTDKIRLLNGSSDRSAIKYVQWLTIAWMSMEATIALIAAVRSHSVVLSAFGADSAIELLSAVTVLWSFSTLCEQREATASKITGSLLIALAVYITAGSAYTLIAAESKPQPSYVGIALLASAAVIMPWLGHRKRRLAAVANSISLRADAAQSSICGYILDCSRRLASQRFPSRFVGRSHCRARPSADCVQGG